MKEIFCQILSMSLSAGILILAIAAVRLWLSRVSRSLTAGLWGIAALRLIFPFSLQSRVSLIPEPAVIQPEQMAQTAALQRPVLRPFVPMQEQTAPAAPTVELLEILAFLWLAVAIGMLLYGLYRYLRLKGTLASAVRAEGNVWYSEFVVSPFVLGVFRPRIYLPYSLTGEEVPYVLAHEQMHIRRADPLWKLLGYALLSVYWFHPLVWLAYGLFSRDLEYACDECVIRHYSREQRAAYSQALLQCTVKCRRFAACPVFFGEAGVKERVLQVLRYKKAKIGILITALLVCGVVAVCFLTDPVSETPAFTEPVSETTGSVSAQTPEEVYPEALQVYSDYVDAFRTGDKERWASYLRFQNDVVRQLELDTFYPCDLQILGWEQLKENLWVISAQYELIYGNGRTEMKLIYNFVTEDQQGWYVIRSAYHIPEELAAGLDLSPYIDPDAIPMTDNMAEQMKICAELREFAEPTKIQWSDPEQAGDPGTEFPMNFNDFIGSTDTWEAEYNPASVTEPDPSCQTVRLYSPEGNMLLIRGDSPWMEFYDGTGACTARYRCFAEGEKVIGYLYLWMQNP